MRIDGIRETQHQTRALGRRERRPRSFLESLACRMDCAVDIARTARRGAADDAAGGRVFEIEGFLRGRVHPLAADKKLQGPCQKPLGRLRGIGHVTSPADFAFFASANCSLRRYSSTMVALSGQ